MNNYDHLSLDDGSLLTDQEIFVIEQIEKGESADLISEFGPDVRLRQLSVLFLEKVLTTGFLNIIYHRNGIIIKNAIIIDTIIFKYALFNNTIRLKYCIFKNDFNLGESHFVENLSLIGSIFLKQVDFYRTKLDKSLFIIDCIFEDFVRLFAASINRSLDARRAIFNKRVSFNSMMAGSVNLKGSIFKASVNMVYMSASNMFLNGTKDNPLKIDNLEIRNTLFKRELEISFANINTLDLKGIQINGQLTLRNVQIRDKFDLRYGRLDALILDTVQLPIVNNSITIDGLSYKFISAGEDKEDWKKLIELIEISKFNIINYARLERFFKECGHNERADEVYVRRKRRELINLKWWYPKKWSIWLLWDKLTNYGRKPGRTVLVSLFIIIMGAFFFDPKLLKPELILSCPWLSHGNYYQNIITRLILSLNNFLPAIDLGLTKELQFSNISFYTFLYLQFHKICGWILIPIGLAAIYTKIK